MSKWTGFMVVALVMSIVSAGPAVAETVVLGSDDFNRADAGNLGASWGYFSNEGNPFAPVLYEQDDPTAGVVDNLVYPIDPPDDHTDVPDDNNDNATMQFRAYYKDYELFSGTPRPTLITVEAEVRNGSWDGLTMHQYVDNRQGAVHAGYNRYTFQTVYRNTQGDPFGGMRIQKMSSVTEVGYVANYNVEPLKALSNDTWVKLRATSDNAGHFTFKVLSLDGLTEYGSLSYTDASFNPLWWAGGYAGISLEYGRMDNFKITTEVSPKPGTIIVVR